MKTDKEVLKEATKLIYGVELDDKQAGLLEEAYRRKKEAKK